MVREVFALRRQPSRDCPATGKLNDGQGRPGTVCVSADNVRSLPARLWPPGLL